MGKNLKDSEETKHRLHEYMEVRVGREVQFTSFCFDCLALCVCLCMIVTVSLSLYDCLFLSLNLNPCVIKF